MKKNKLLNITTSIFIILSLFLLNGCYVNYYLAYTDDSQVTEPQPPCWDCPPPPPPPPPPPGPTIDHREPVAPNPPAVNEPAQPHRESGRVRGPVNSQDNNRQVDRTSTRTPRD
jgi:hypothetical protein